MQLAVPAGKKTPSRSTPTGHPAATLSCRYHFHPIFQPSPPPLPAPLRRKRYPCCLSAQLIFHFKRFFFFSRKNVFPCIRRSLGPPRCFLLGHDVDCPFFLSLHNYLTFPFFGYCFVANHSIWPARSERLHRLIIIPTSSCQLSALYLGNVYVPIPNTPTSHLPTRPL